MCLYYVFLFGLRLGLNYLLLKLDLVHLSKYCNWAIDLTTVVRFPAGQAF
jgi:hypothetical protein